MDLKDPQVIMAAAAVAGLLYAVVQVASARKDAREQTAKAIFTEYHLKGLEYPDFSDPQELSTLKVENETLNESREKFLKYAWFVSLLLLVCGEILRLGRPTILEKILPLRRGMKWDDIVTDKLGWHRAYLEHLVNDPKYRYEFEYQSPELQQKIRQVVNAPKDPDAPITPNALRDPPGGGRS
jgi:hypothetical protein